MKSIMTSVSPYLCGKIASGKCKILVRKFAPKEVPFKAYIYCAKISDKKHRSDKFNIGIWKGNEHVIGEFICDKVDEYKYDYGCGYYPGDGVDIDDDTILETAIDREDINIYAKGKTLYGWYISDLRIYDRPKELSEFYTIDESGSDCCCGCVYHETPLEEMPCKTCTGERRYLYRPPQSWCYVEEI